MTMNDYHPWGINYALFYDHFMTYDVNGCSHDI